MRLHHNSVVIAARLEEGLANAEAANKEKDKEDSQSHSHRTAH